MPGSRMNRQNREEKKKAKLLVTYSICDAWPAHNHDETTAGNLHTTKAVNSTQPSRGAELSLAAEHHLRKPSFEVIGQITTNRQIIRSTENV